MKNFYTINPKRCRGRLHEVVVSERFHFLTRGGRLRELPTTGL